MEQRRTRWLVLVFATFMPIAHVIMGLANSDVPTSLWQYFLAMLICLALVVLLCWDSGKNAMPLWAAWSVVAGVLLMDLLVNSVLPAGIHPGYASWQNGAIQMLLVALTFRDRMRLAWLGMGLFAVADMSASLALGLSVTDALALVLTPIMWMVIATAVRSVLGRSKNNIAVYSAQSQLAATKLAKEHAHGLYRKQWLLELEQATRPALEAIAGQDAGQGLSASDRLDLALLEAELRDQIRGRALVTPEIQQATRAARKRGVKVDLLDDRKTSLPDTVAADVFAQLLDILGAAQSGTLRARALPVGESPAVTILAFDGSADQNETYVEISEPHPVPAT